MSSRIIHKFKKKLWNISGKGFVLDKSPGSSFIKGEGVEIINTNIILAGKSQLIIEDNVKLKGYDIHVIDGYLKIGEYSQLIKGRQTLSPDYFY